MCRNIRLFPRVPLKTTSLVVPSPSGSDGVQEATMSGSTVDAAPSGLIE